MPLLHDEVYVCGCWTGSATEMLGLGLESPIPHGHSPSYMVYVCWYHYPSRTLWSRTKAESTAILQPGYAQFVGRSNEKRPS